MECKLKCDKPGDIVYTLTITATAKEFEQVRDQLNANALALEWPSRNLSNQINDLLGQARKVYWPVELYKE